MSMVSIAIIVGVLAVLICIGGLVYVVKLRWTKEQQHNHHMHHNHHLQLQQKGKLTTSGVGGVGGVLTNSSSMTPNTNSLLRRMNNTALIRPGNLPIKDKILLPGGGGGLGTEGSNGHHHHLHQYQQQHPHHQLQPGGDGEQPLYDEKNPDVVPYNKGNL